MKPLKTSITVKINRSEINFAPYNPRDDDPKLVSELKANFQKVGYLGGIVWNSTTGNLVGGHKRVMAHDIYYKYDGSNDYQIKVEAVELDDKTEKEQNIFLNKKQGKFDKIRLYDLLQEIEPINAGFSQEELTTLTAMIPTVSDVSQLQQDVTDMEQLNRIVDLDAIQNVKDAKKAQANKAFLKHVDMNNSIIVKFETAEEKAYFCEAIGIDFNLKTINGEVLLDIIDK
jgi:hypothetical protein